MSWQIGLHDDFLVESETLPRPVRNEMLASLKVLAEFGPALGRPRVDTLNGSSHSNMKELRFNAGNQVWRAAFAFDPARTAIVLAAGEKSGGSERRLYHQLIAKADRRLDEHLKQLKQRKQPRRTHETATGSHRGTSRGG